MLTRETYLFKQLAEMTMAEFDALPRDWREAIAHSPYGEMPYTFDMDVEDYEEGQEEVRQWMQTRSLNEERSVELF